MFGRKRIVDLESELVHRKSRSELWESCYDGMVLDNTRLATSNEKQAREIEHINRKLVLAERAAKTAIDANEELDRLHAKDQLEIRELKADISEQVRINRVYAQEVGSQREVINGLMVIDTSRFFKPGSSMFTAAKPEPEPEPEPTEEPQQGYGPEYLKLQRKVKRLKARVKKLTSDNKAMATQILRTRNSM